MSITSDECNFLIHRYLQESGYHHSAFAFGYEALITRSNINGDDVSPGALITYLQKGLQYLEIEAHLRNDGTEIQCDESFSLLAPHECKEKPSDDEEPKTKKSKKSKKEPDVVPMEETPSIDIPEHEVTVLQGHDSEVFICAWNPTSNRLASGSGDSTARIWDIPHVPSGAAAQHTAKTPIAILHHVNENDENSKDVTTLDWNHDGSLLATGSIDGLARIWNDKGQLLKTLNRHKEPIFSLKWNKSGKCLLSGSVDTSAIIWDADSGDVKQQFSFHTAPTLDVDWKDDTTFATCSTDKMIYVCQLGENKPIKQFQGHTDEVNAIKWDPSGNVLASCSDDTTAKIWNMNSDKPLHTFNHSKEIYTIKWSPTGPGTKYSYRDLVLASASFDASIKIWDAERGTCVHSLTRHKDPVYSVAFSPTGEYLASGSSDECLHIWSVKDGELVRTYKGNGGIFEVCWNSAGDRVAACFSNNTVCVLDFRKM